MSAYVVSTRHIDFLVTAYRHMTHRNDGAYFYHDGEPVYVDTNAHEIARALYRENIESVSYRYPRDTFESLPGPNVKPAPIDYQYRPWMLDITPVQVLKAIDGYVYQSCEHPDWDTSMAHSFCESLRRKAIQRLDGYDDAPWTITEQTEQDIRDAIYAKREEIKARTAEAWAEAAADQAEHY